MRQHLYPTATDTGWLAEVKAHGVAGVAAALGLKPAKPVMGGRSTWQCPACGDVTRHHKTGNKHGAIGLRRDGHGWACFQCEAKGDAVTLVAWRVLGRGQWSGPEDAARLRHECALRGLCTFAPGEMAPPGAVPLRPLPQPVAPADELVRPPAEEVTALWDACERLAAMPSWDGGPEWCGEPRRYLAGRGLDVATLAALGVARILPPPERFAYPGWWPSRRARTWRVVVLAYEADGTPASIHARAIVKLRPGVPKTLWPRGPSSEGLLLACPRGVAFLRGELPELPPAVLVVEGLTDLLAEAQIQSEAGQHWPVLSVGSGSARAVGAVRWPRGVRCLVATHEDKAGDRYEEEVSKALPSWVPFKRVPLTQRKRDKA